MSDVAEKQSIRNRSRMCYAAVAH